MKPERPGVAQAAEVGALGNPFSDLSEHLHFRGIRFYLRVGVVVVL